MYLYTISLNLVILNATTRNTNCVKKLVSLAKENLCPQNKVLRILRFKKFVAVISQLRHPSPP